MNVSTIFRPNYDRYEGVRPINVYLLRLLFLLVFLIVGHDSWTGLFIHQGPWDPVRAAAVCMWAGYSALSIIGVFHPLKMLPIVAFEILYKTTWLLVVAYPLWSAHQLAGTPAGEMTRVFIGVPVLAVIMPWKYFVETYVLNRPRPRLAVGAAA